jgi:putative membrane protein
MNIYRSSLILAAVTAWAGCNRADRAAIDTAAGNVGDRLDSALTATTREYTDAEFTGLLNVVNDAEIEMGNAAAAKATDPRVREFAQRIAREHRSLKAEVDAVAQKLSLTPTIPGNDEGLVETHRTAMTDLGAKAKGADYDEDFLEHEISMHRKILDEVNDALSRTQNADMRALLERARTGLQSHLTTAEALERETPN